MDENQSLSAQNILNTSIFKFTQQKNNPPTTIDKKSNVEGSLLSKHRKIVTLLLCRLRD